MPQPGMEIDTGCSSPEEPPKQNSSAVGNRHLLKTIKSLGRTTPDFNHVESRKLTQLLQCVLGAWKQGQAEGMLDALVEKAKEVEESLNETQGLWQEGSQVGSQGGDQDEDSQSNTSEDWNSD
ncbi:hypothetical protein RhiXN_02422 [Rhizoctonia solani]|uniref:Uncharacterized protein n=1 Tax=Rhizoctonia solani TaxID=456999 RepID=A0A8H8NQA7_9AGAM|nr:uncharacterized protein RhiXN_02422 [Rhizoctonia solani]QRW17500.1 hypothetical protein RhiXN_02422 [Rhizoctonia solani]